MFLLSINDNCLIPHLFFNNSRRLEMMLNVLVAREHQLWLDQEDNEGMWYGNSTALFRAMERQMLITG